MLALLPPTLLLAQIGLVLAQFGAGETMPPTYGQTLLGMVGAVLAWFMSRNERAINRLTHKIDGLYRAHLLDTLTRPNVPAHAKRLAEQMLEEPERR